MYKCLVFAVKVAEEILCALRQSQYRLEVYDLGGSCHDIRIVL